MAEFVWNRDLKFKLTLITITGSAAIVLLIRHNMWFDFRSAATACGTVGLLLPFAVVFNGRNLDAFCNLLTGFLCMVVFNLCLTVLTYAGTPLNAPLADDWLIHADESMGIHLPSIVLWTRSHPSAGWIFERAYFSVLPSTLLAIVVLGFDSDTRRLREFVLHFILGGLITTVLYFFYPAEGPCAAYGYQPPPDQQRFLDHFYSLRAGSFPLVSMSNLEGLITFPSFHTTWALLVAYAFRHYRWIFPPMLLLNLTVVASTVTTGRHYATDVIGGTATTIGAVFLSLLLSHWLTGQNDRILYHAQTQTAT